MVKTMNLQLFNRLFVVICGVLLLTGQTVDAAAAKKPVKKSSTCVRCKSKAEGVDKSAAARANSWVGTIIGVNFGEHSIVITEATALDHIKKFAQRSVRVTSDTELFKDGDPVAFADLDVGQRVTAQGSYDAKKRIVTADRIDIGVKTVAIVPKSEKISASQVFSASEDAPNSFKRTIQMGSAGAEVLALQKILIDRGYLPNHGVKTGTFGPQTREALKKFQAAAGLPTTGIAGPQTRAVLNK